MPKLKTNRAAAKRFPQEEQDRKGAEERDRICPLDKVCRVDVPFRVNENKV